MKLHAEALEQILLVTKPQPKGKADPYAQTAVKRVQEIAKTTLAAVKALAKSGTLAKIRKSGTAWKIGGESRQDKGITVWDLANLHDQKGNGDCVMTVRLEGHDTDVGIITGAVFEPNEDGQPGGVMWLHVDRKLEKVIVGALEGGEPPAGLNARGNSVIALALRFLSDHLDLCANGGPNGDILRDMGGLTRNEVRSVVRKFDPSDKVTEEELKPAEDPADVTVANHGSIFMFTPHTDAAKEWIKEHVTGEQSWMGDSLAVEHRYAQNLVQGMQGDGLNVK